MSRRKFLIFTVSLNQEIKTDCISFITVIYFKKDNLRRMERELEITVIDDWPVLSLTSQPQKSSTLFIGKPHR